MPFPVVLPDTLMTNLREAYNTDIIAEQGTETYTQAVRIRGFFQQILEAPVGRLPVVAGEALDAARFADMEARINRLREERNTATTRITELQDEITVAAAVHDETDEEKARLESELLLALRNQPRAAGTGSGPKMDRVAAPKTFDGRRDTYQTFKSALKNKFRSDAEAYRDEQHRLSVAAGFLGEGTHDIIKPFLLDDRIDLDTMAEFWTVLDRAYDDPDRKGTAERQLQALTQGAHEFAVYCADFLRLKADTEWNDAAYMHQLKTGVAKEIRTASTYQVGAAPTNLNELADQYHQLDVKIRENKAFERNIPTTSSGTRRTPAASNSPVVPVSQRTTSNPLWRGQAPMDLSANRRSSYAAQNARKQARWTRLAAQGLCFTCESPDHTKATCPMQARMNTMQANATARRSAAATPDPAVPTVPEADPAPQDFH